MKRLVHVRLVIVTDASLDQVRAATDELLGHGLVGLEDSRVWEASVSEAPTSVSSMLATSLGPIPGIVRAPTAHDVECQCAVCEEDTGD